MISSRLCLAILVIAPSLAWGQTTRPDARALGSAALAPYLLVWRDTTDGILRDGANPAAAWALGSAAPVVAVGVVRRQGEWRRPQEAERALGVIATADGGRPIGRWWVGGQFGYLRANDRNVRWSSVADPYSGSPYVWADSVGGDWRRDHVLAAASLSSPRFNAVRGGMAVRYAIGQGSRDNDPRPLYRIRRLSLTPGLTLDVGPVRVGGTVSVGFEREEGEIGHFSQTDPFVFRLRGMTTFDRTGLRTADRTRAGHSTSVGAQVADRRSRWSLAFDHGIDRDSTFDGVGSPVEAGRFRRTWSRGVARARYRRFEGMIHGRTSRGRGTDPVFRAVNVLAEDDSAAVVVRTWRGGSLRDASLVLATTAELNRSLRRDIVAETQWHTAGLDMSIGLRLRQRLAGQPVLVVGQAGWRQVLDADYAAGRSSVMTSTLGEADYRHFAADGAYWLVGSGIEIGGGRHGDLLLMVAFARRHASGGVAMRRDALTLTIVMQ